ncbi:hypothetical protein JW905_16340 [bacterium]|nr:hypothetical protein [candidate division CSSED10-310 bacterium]
MSGREARRGVHGKVDPLMIIVLIILVLGAIAFVNYRKHGEFTLVPTKRTPAEQELWKLETELAKISKRMEKVSQHVTGADEASGDIWYQEHQLLLKQQEELNEKVKKQRVIVEKEHQAAGGI